MPSIYLQTVWHVYIYIYIHTYIYKLSIDKIYISHITYIIYRIYRIYRRVFIVLVFQIPVSLKFFKIKNWREKALCYLLRLLQN